MLPRHQAQADNTLAPIIGSATYSVASSTDASTVGAPSVANPNNSFDNKTVIQDFINYASSHGGGTVIIPSAANVYLSSGLTMAAGVNLEVDGTLRDKTAGATLLSSSGVSNIELSGTGILDGNQSNTSGTSNNLISFTNGSRILVQGNAGAPIPSGQIGASTNHLSIENSGHMHLIIQNDNNVTVNDLVINDPKSNNLVSNSDGIDFSGNHFLIQNSSIADGDDDIVAKPNGTIGGSATTTDVTIQNDSIGVGHGISIGGQTSAGLNGMTVQNITFNGTTNGLRLKAGQNSIDSGGGGITKNVTFNNITMTGVSNPIIISSWYNTQDHYGSRELSGSQLHGTDPTVIPQFDPANPGDPSVVVNENNNTPLQPFFDNISYSNITATGGSNNVAIIYGLNSTPADGNQPLRNIDSISFNDVNLSGAWGADIYYTSNLDISGLTVTATNGANENLFGDTFVAVPEPASLSLLGAAGIACLGRRRARRTL